MTWVHVIESYLQKQKCYVGGHGDTDNLELRITKLKMRLNQVNLILKKKNFRKDYLN